MHDGSAPAVGRVDCHFHVIGPVARFPMVEGRSYTPALASLAEWRAALGPHGVTHGVVIQPSFYGLDNRALLEALREGENSLVGIAAVEPDISDARLEELTAAGVRGVRMAHFEPGDPRAMGGFVPFAVFESLEGRLFEHGLHLQLFTDSRLLPAIAGRLRSSRVPIIIDHMGRSPALLGTDHAGHLMMRQLLVEGCIWVKLSGIANISNAAPGYDDVRRVHESLVNANVDQLVWGSDWPHTRSAGETPRTAHLLELLLEWTPSLVARDAILSGNARRLYRL